MRLLVLSIGIGILAAGGAQAQTAGGSGTTPQLPVGQTFKNFQFPLYQDGTLKATLTAAKATGITQNRAETTDLKIELYGSETTTITSPKADLYVNERKMRSKDTVHVVHGDVDATAQTCDLDLSTKKYLLRTNVKVILKNFDANLSPEKHPIAPAPAAGTVPEPSTAPVSVSPPRAPLRTPDAGSLLDTPGGYSSTNSAPLPPTSTDNK